MTGSTKYLTEITSGLAMGACQTWKQHNWFSTTTGFVQRPSLQNKFATPE